MINEGKSTEDAKEVEPPVVETKEVKEEEAKGLSTRDALEVAIEGTKEVKKDDTRRESSSVDSRPRKVSESREDEISGASSGEKTSADKETKATSLEPPAEYNAEEKADFLTLSKKGQEAQLRLHRSRMKVLDDIKRERQEVDTYKRLVTDAEPFIKAMGLKDAPAVAIQKALKMWREFEDGDPIAAASNYLIAKGKPIPKEWSELPQEQSRLAHEQITPLQEKLDRLETKIAQDDQAKAAQILGQAWRSFAEEKNASGKPKYPDINDTESGLKLAANIGSLVRGDTLLSQQFIATVRSSNPDLTYPELLEEAYRFSKGKVDTSEAPRTQDTQKHIAKSSRAASSVPGRGGPSSVSGPVKKMSRREALAAAIAEARENEGA